MNPRLNEAWPVLTHYEDRHLARAGFHLEYHPGKGRSQARGGASRTVFYVKDGGS